MTQFGNSTKFNTRMNGEMIIAHTNDMGSATIVLMILENTFMVVSFPGLTHYYCKATTKNVNGFFATLSFPKGDILYLSRIYIIWGTHQYTIILREVDGEYDCPVILDDVRIVYHIYIMSKHDSILQQKRSCISLWAPPNPGTYGVSP